jgi:hypothetical protein
LFYVQQWAGNINANGVHIYNNSGSTSAGGTTIVSATNRLYYLNFGLSATGNSLLNNLLLQPFVSNTAYSPVQWAGASDGSYLALCLSQRDFAGNISRINFMYSGLLSDINTGFGYYNSSLTTQTISLVSFAGGSNAALGAHYISSAGKLILSSGDASYSIACSDGQTPTSQWATDFYAFDNNTTLGFPAIGRVRGMLLGIGTYTLGKPVKIIGSVFPDGGSPWYLPVGTFAGKTLLMRCYSSMA